MILVLDKGTYFGLNSVGIASGSCASSMLPLREVWESMQREFDAPGDTLRLGSPRVRERAVVEGVADAE